MRFRDIEQGQADIEKCGGCGGLLPTPRSFRKNDSNMKYRSSWDQSPASPAESEKRPCHKGFLGKQGRNQSPAAGFTEPVWRLHAGDARAAACSCVHSAVRSERGAARKRREREGSAGCPRDVLASRGAGRLSAIQQWLHAAESTAGAWASWHEHALHWSLRWRACAGWPRAAGTRRGAGYRRASSAKQGQAMITAYNICYTR